jgi:hypothetical protein
LPSGYAWPEGKALLPLAADLTFVEIASYRLPVVTERVNGSYQAMSPAVDGFLVWTDALDEVLALAPGLARALLVAMQDKGVKPPEMNGSERGCRPRMSAASR